MTLTSQIATAQEIDENLFLLRLLEIHYTLWPVNLDDPVQFAADLRELRDEMISTRTYIQSQPHLDQRLAESYGEALSLLDNYRVTVGGLVGIEIDLNAEALKDGMASGVKAVALGASFVEPTTGIIVGGVSFVTDLAMTGQRREHDAQMKVSAFAQAYQDLAVETFTRAKHLGQTMAQDYDWGRHEAGFEMSNGLDQLLTRLVAEEDYAGLTELMRQEAAKRPRDLFAQTSYQSFRAINKNESPDQMLLIARDTEAFAQLIPDGVFYDDYRYALADAVSDYAVAACLAQYRLRGESSPTSGQAARLALEQILMMRRLDPNDYSGYTRFVHGLALVLNQETVSALPLFKETSPNFGEDPSWLYWMACAQSMAHHHAEALDLLKRSITNGYWDLELVRSMPQLQPLANAKPDAFAELVTPQWTWNVTDDWVWDDVILTNTSLFPLTNIQFTAKLKQGGVLQTVNLEHDLLMPGETHTWVDVVDGPSGQWDDTSTASLICDEVPKP